MMRRFSRAIARKLLRAWAKLGKAPGLRYEWIQRIGPVLGELRPLLGRLPNGCVVECDVRDEVARQIYFSGAYEGVEAFLFTRLLRPGMTVLDVGANLGQYTLLASTAVGPGGSVHSFEPVPVNFARVSRNVLNNGLTNVTLNNAAAWHEATTLRFGLPADADANKGSFQVVTGGDNGTTSYAASAIRLDDYAAEQGLGRVDLIKMDIEGAECHALRGAAEIIRRDCPIILMEVNRGALEALGSGTRPLFDLVNSWNYQILRIGLEPSQCLALEDLESFGQGNILLHRGDLPASITRGWDLKTANRWAISGT